MKYDPNNSRLSNRPGFTLVEILIVIAIMSVLVALIIPRVRTINKDRNIRETARVVGSMFAAASQRAVVDGKAGVVIRRNGNFIDRTTGVARYYSGRTLFEMRAVPDWSGDSYGDKAFQLSPGKIQVPLPFDRDVNNPVVAINDRCYLNNQEFAYTITEVLEVGGFLELGLRTYDDNGPGSNSPVPISVNPVPNIPASGVPFRIERSPRIVQSSAVDLPAGYHIDLRYSGWFDDTNDDVLFTEEIVAGDPNTYDITVLFDKTGGIDSVIYGEIPQLPAPPSPIFKIPTGTLYLFVAEDDLNLALTEDLLVRDTNLWVMVNHLMGGVSIGYNATQFPVATPADFANTTLMRGRIEGGRAITIERLNAAQ